MKRIIPFDDYNHRLHPGTDFVGSVLPTWGNHALTNGWKLLESDMSKIYRIRKLTPLECHRLMGVKDEDFYKMKNAGISDSQLYKLAGNSIVVDVLEAIFRNINFTEKPLRVFEAFAGYGSQSMALRNIGIEHEVVGISEIDKYAIMAYNATHEPTTNYGDISKIDWGGGYQTSTSLLTLSLARTSATLEHRLASRKDPAPAVLYCGSAVRLS